MTLISKLIAGSLVLSQGVVTGLRVPAVHKLSSTTASSAVVDRRALLAGGAASVAATLFGEYSCPQAISLFFCATRSWLMFECRECNSRGAGLCRLGLGRQVGTPVR